jgi:hypothetical protein
VETELRQDEIERLVAFERISYRGIIPICRRNLGLTPHRDDAEKLRE